MNVVNILHLKVTIGTRNLLDLKNLHVQEKQRIGLVGKNGSGKTTLFKALLGEVDTDISNFSTKGRLAMLPQLKYAETTKSGGEISQDYIVQVLNQSPNILLADEPTTNLDTSHVEWVESKLSEYQGTILLISHDRTLLDSICNTIWELEEGEITEYKGNYSDYIEQKENKKKHQQKEYEKFKQKEQQLEEAIIQKDRQAERATKAPKNLSSSEARIKGAKPYFAKLQKGLHQNRKALQTRLEKLEEIKKPKEEYPIKMTLPNTRSFENKVILRAQKVAGQVGDKKLWKPTTFFIRGKDKVGIIGANGSGKTTLLKKIMDKEDKSIFLSPAVKIGYFDQNINRLDTKKSILENVKEESKQDETLIRTVLARLGFSNEDVYKEVSVLSGGERVKVSLAKLFVSDCNTLILDEPTNFLDVYALEALEELLIEYEGTVLFVSHDRQFISSIATKILSFDDEKNLEMFNGTYEEFNLYHQKKDRDTQAEQLLKTEMAITSVLNKLSEPLISESEKEDLEEEFQELITKKRVLEEDNT
ncbi:MAG TPA: ABC-F type ribosomal protection protein [Candidatus Atopostipes pullistercoris]|uniref:ABC-F type ribosomal protection protein n=1 Tax=Candidatus Atopostipes pullistercoris TaxID=2838467 RepID=A0A9D2G0X8_9LACT|nr:ABC-F type ribosomal protection protein [Candidatus Atopostipes pullistercoris]